MGASLRCQFLPESEARAARRAWLRAVEAGDIQDAGPAEPRPSLVPSDSEDKLLREVLRRSLTLVETDAATTELQRQRS